MREYRIYLTEHEKSHATIQKYVRELVWFLSFLQGEEPTKAKVLEYREQLQQSHHARTVNAKLSAIHSYLDYLGLAACKVRFLKIQHTVFVDDSRDLTEAEYHRLLDAAKRKKDSRLYHVMLAICTTGIRVSELSFLTVEALHKGKAEIRMKGKIRTILLTKELCRKLNAYAKEKGIRTGYLFCTRTGKPLDRSNICHDMKKLCRAARVNPEKVFPHNLRHLFANCYYAIKKNLAYLADILGHASVDTTRIYVAMGTREHERTLQRMHLIS
nr:tyrosine-type recombinase/integrase [Butyricicoccus sp. BIOML-A1]